MENLSKLAHLTECQLYKLVRQHPTINKHSMNGRYDA